MVKNHILCMACFCSEDSRRDDRRAKFSLVYEIRASKADSDDVTAFSLTRQSAYNTMALAARMVLEQPNFCENFSLTIKFRTHVE